MDGLTFFLEPERTNVFAAASASAGYLAHCTVIDESEARQIHPQLFTQLES